MASHSLSHSIFPGASGSTGIVAGRAMLVVLTILQRSHFLTESMSSGKHFRCVAFSALLAMSSTQQQCRAHREAPCGFNCSEETIAFSLLGSVCYIYIYREREIDRERDRDIITYSYYVRYILAERIPSAGQADPRW